MTLKNGGKPLKEAVELVLKIKVFLEITVLL
jgi:hypothetical protein